MHAAVDTCAAHRKVWCSNYLGEALAIVLKRGEITK